MKKLAFAFELSLACLIWCGCTAVSIDKHPDGSADIKAVSLFQDITIPTLRFAATRPSTTQPGTERFEMQGYDAKAQVETLNKILDKLPPVP